MAKNKPITATFWINGKQVDRLTPEQCEVIAKRVEEAMNIYYANHPEEYAQLKF